MTLRQKTVLVLGATGRFGRAAAQAFAEGGWEVRRFDRQKDSLWDAAWGADVIVNAWNPAYPDWAREVPKLTAQIIEVARASKAKVMIPGNVYVYGPEAPERLNEATPHRAVNPLGRVRIEMERSFRASGVRTVILRGGDFIDTSASGNWFDKVITTKLRDGKVTYPGALDRPHAWAFLPDMARAMVLLAEKRHDLQRFEDIPFAGFTLSGRDLAKALSEALDRPLHLSQMSWFPLQIARPFWPMARHLLEMRYLWDKPHRLSNSRLRSLCPEFTPTEVVEALSLAIEAQVQPHQPRPARSLHIGGKRIVGRRPHHP